MYKEGEIAQMPAPHPCHLWDGGRGEDAVGTPVSALSTAAVTPDLRVCPRLDGGPWGRAAASPACGQWSV